MMTTRTGEVSVKVRAAAAVKSIRPLPDKWHGLSDTDTRFRQRYVDLIVNEQARRVFEIRAPSSPASAPHLPKRLLEAERRCARQAGGATASRSSPITTLNMPLYRAPPSCTSSG